MFNFIKKILGKKVTDKAPGVIQKMNKAFRKKVRYEVCFLYSRGDDEHSLISHKGRKSLYFQENIVNYYDNETATIKLLYPIVIKELIDKVGVKEIQTLELTTEFMQDIIILNNNWKVFVSVLSQDKFSGLGVENNTETYLVCVSNESETVGIVKKLLGENKRSNCGGICWVAEKNIKYSITQKGLKEIGSILGKEFDNNEHYIKG